MCHSVYQHAGLQSAISAPAIAWRHAYATAAVVLWLPRDLQ